MGVRRPGPLDRPAAGEGGTGQRGQHRAPEAHWDSRRHEYVAFWASGLYTADDPGHSVIDSTVIKDKGTYYGFTKDERDPSSGSPCSKFITAEKARDLTDTSYDFVADCVGSGALQRGEGPTVFRSDNEKKWYLFIDEYGLRGCVPFETTDLASGTWTPSTDYALPAGPRHGTVLPVTGAEYERLLRTYGQVS